MCVLHAASSKAQTTNCQVTGNQIICQTSQPPPLVTVPPPTPAQPLLTPEMLSLIAERNRIASEARQREVERFTAELSSHDAWTSIKAGSSYHVRMTGDRVYLVGIPPVGANWSSNVECVPGKTAGTWDCKRYVHLLRFAQEQMFRKNKSCLLEANATLNSVTRDRIEITADSFSPKDVDWGQCKVKKTSSASDVLIPRDPKN